MYSKACVLVNDDSSAEQLMGRQLEETGAGMLHTRHGAPFPSGGQAEDTRSVGREQTMVGDLGIRASR